MWLHLKATIFRGCCGSADNKVCSTALFWSPAWSGVTQYVLRVHPLPPNFSLTHVLISTVWWEWALGHSLSVSRSMIQRTWLHQCQLTCWHLNLHRRVHIHTYTLSLTHVCFLFLLFPHLSSSFCPYFTSLWAWLDMWLYDTLPVYVCHVTVTSHGHASVHSVFNARVYGQRISQLSVCHICGGLVFPEKNVARSRLHDDGVGNENI